MKIFEGTTSELAFLFKLLPLLHEVDTIDRLYRLLLAVVTSGRTVGYPRAILFVPDEEDGVIRGRYGVERLERTGSRSRHQAKKTGGTGFDEMARSVFDNFEHVDATDLTVKARSYSVPLKWYRSALVKAARTTYPVLAERGASEFASDTFFNYFGVTSYIALPIEIHGRVAAVLAVDRPSREDPSSTDEISVLYSLVQQTARAAERLIENASNRRRARILAKLHASLYTAANSSEFEESLKAALAMVCGGVEGSVCLLKGGDSGRIIRAESASRRVSAAEDEAFTAAVEGVLDLAANTLESVGGDASHKCLKSAAAKTVAFFFASPLLVGRDCVGALAVFVQNGDGNARKRDFEALDKAFLELCGGVIASGMQSARDGGRVRRLEDLIQELGSNLVRERERSRIGDRSIEYHMRAGEEIRRLRGILSGEDPAARIGEIARIVGAIESHASAYWDDVVAAEGDCAMVDLFELVRRAAEAWRPAAESRGIHVSVRIPQEGPQMLLDQDRISSAVEKILAVTLDSLIREDKVMIECSLADGRALVCVADTGNGLPGDAMSRLFMPFADVTDREKGTRALSLAGEILQRHSAEIMIKSSPSWRTILVLSFPTAAGRDRRKRPSERRRRYERRVTKAAVKS
jgi:signal transduction histidine kinase